MEQGYMPHLKRMMQDGLTAELESVVPPVTGPAWTSFMTGKNPSKHGIFEFTRFDEHEYTWKLNNSQFICGKTLWHLLSENAKRVIVLNLPYTYPPYQVNGLMVCGWDAPSVDANFTFPSDLRNEILKTITDYRSTHDVWLWKHVAIDTDAQFNRFIDQQIRGFENDAKLALHFLETQEWDVFMTHFQHTDWLQHKLWPYIECACSEKVNKNVRLEKVRECYKRFDELVGNLMNKAESQRPVRIVLSDHGFGPDRGNICANYYLNKWGYLFLKNEARRPLRDFFRRSKFSALRYAYQRLARTKHGIDASKYKSWSEYVLENVGEHKLEIDWERTKVALVTGSEVGFIFVNVKGRGPCGNVDPGPEYEDLVSEVLARFQDLRHPRTGEELFERVARGRDVYAEVGEGILLPDIVLIASHGYGFSLGAFDKAPEQVPEGCHRPKGVLFMRGDGLNSTVRDFHPRLIDMAPTILHLVGVPVPRDMDGRVLENIWIDRQHVSYEDAHDTPIHQTEAAYSAEEAEIIEQRLKGLGYLE
jgi:predicted AlkP superfamily phosphohydrolase/phosphomutase